MVTYLKIDRNKTSVVYLAKQLHVNADPGTLFGTLSFAFWAPLVVFDFLDLIYELSWDSPCRAEKNSYKRQYVLVLTCPTSFPVCILLLPKNCPEPLCSLVTEKKVVFSSLHLCPGRCLHMTFVYRFSLSWNQEITIVFSIINNAIPWPSHTRGMQYMS